jgi:hypothetical protein
VLAFGRMNWDKPTREDVARRTIEGKSEGEDSAVPIGVRGPKGLSDLAGSGHPTFFRCGTLIDIGTSGRDARFGV